VLLETSRATGAKGLGIDIDLDCVNKAKKNVDNAELAHLIHIEQCSIEDRERVIEYLRDVTVVFLFMLPAAIDYLSEILETALVSNNCRVVCNTFRINKWVSRHSRKISDSLHLYLYTAPFSASMAYYYHV